jgi:hypothetical protein
MDRKKELKLQYKQMKPPMGVFIIRSKFSNKCYIEATTDFRARFNSVKVKLAGNFHPNRELQKAWNEHGEAGFRFEILENLEYDKDETKTDYKDDLALLQMIWEEKVVQEGLELYKKRP